MTRPIRNATEARGFVPDKHNLVSFGGAGGQHACAIASNLGIKRVLIHKYSSILSAYGISLAELQSEASLPFTGVFTSSVLPLIQSKIGELKTRVKESLLSQGVDTLSIKYEATLSMRYKGSDTNISIRTPEDNDYGASFVATHKREFAFSLSRDVVVDAIKVRGIGSSRNGQGLASPLAGLEKARTCGTRPPISSTQNVYINGSWKDIPIYKLESLAMNSIIEVCINAMKLLRLLTLKGPCFNHRQDSNYPR